MQPCGKQYQYWQPPGQGLSDHSAHRNKTRHPIPSTSANYSFDERGIAPQNHFPINFKGGDKIITSFILNNTGNASSDPLYTILMINGEEKNKVGDIIIPAKGFADIKIPWIAVKGKNDVDIVVK